jgi:tetratricopeptide (TPR) repeat protein
LSGAWETYQKGSKRFPGNPELAKASGRVAVSLFRYEDAERDLSAAPADAETSYYLGLAHVALGKSEPARASFEVARKDPRYQVAANLQLAELSAREQAFPKALQYLKDLPSPGDDERVGEESVALTRASGAKEQSKRLAQEWVKRFPNNTFFRYELALAGREDDGLWMHLGADAARVLDLALLYHRLGMNADAMAVLRRTYPAVPPEQSEPGLAPPQEDPQVGYLLAYLVGALWDAPSRMRTLYVFPNRAEMLPVFRTAIDKNPKDASAHYLLGCLLFSRGWVEQAIEQWQEARKLNPKIPALHSSLARALFEVQHKSEEAAQIYEEGVKYDPENAGLYIGWNAVLKAQNKPPADRAAMIKRYPLDAAMPENLVRLLITTLREDGKNDEADAWVRTHFFSRAEGGAPPPEVQTGKVIAAVSKPAPKPEAPANPEKFGFTQREESAPAVATIRSVRAKQDAAPITDPADPFWKDIPAVASDNNQYGNMVSPRKTEFRSRWTEGYLYFLFVCPFEELYLRPNPQTSRDTVGLWDWDVAEVFLGNDFEHIKRYKEFEVSPQSEWVDLDINLEARSDDGWKWNSGFVVAARIDKDAKVWYGAMKIPYKSIDTRPPRPGLKLRANLYRIEGPEPARKFICWQPTHSPTFHMPVAFGRLELVE